MVALPPPVQPGDRVAVLSPSWCAPAQFPAIHEQALSRIRDLGLQPVEYPFTRVQGTPAERASDLMSACEDESIGAVMATIGGDDQMPPAEECFRMLRNLGERGILGAASALLWARPPVTSREVPRTQSEAAAARAERREAVLRAVADYNPALVVTLDVDFGHTSPQLVLPYGGMVTVDGEQQLITAHFG